MTKILAILLLLAGVIPAVANTNSVAATVDIYYVGIKTSVVTTPEQLAELLTGQFLYSSDKGCVVRSEMAGLVREAPVAQFSEPVHLVMVFSVHVAGQGYKLGCNPSVEDCKNRRGPRYIEFCQSPEEQAEALKTGIAQFWGNNPAFLVHKETLTTVPGVRVSN
jgi:hypothetical protein